MSDADSASAMDEGVAIDQILEWIGFAHAEIRNAIMEDAFESYRDIADLTSDDIINLAKSFAKRTPMAQRIVFGTKRTKRLKALRHWVRDFYRVSEEPNIVDMDEEEFRNALNTAAERAQIRQALRDKSDSLLKEASPGLLKDETKWVSWEPAFRNYLSLIVGSFGVPLVYVIRDNQDPEVDFEGDYVQKCIACAPLSGVYFEADKRQVHQIILSFIQGQAVEQWIKSLRKHANGRLDFSSIQDYFSGEGNSNRRLAVADNLRDTLHYKSERAMKFATFLTKVEEMCNIYESAGEKWAWDDEKKIRWLWPRIQSQQLASQRDALKAQRLTNDDLSYKTIVNSLATDVAELPENLSMRGRSISATLTYDPDKGPSSGIYKPDGTIHTGWYENFNKLSKAEIDEVKKARGKTPGNSKKQGKKDKRQIKKLKRQNKKMKRRVAAMKNKHRSEGDSSDHESSDESDEVRDDAGNQFGGRESMKKKKQKS